jgi:hypothetical protein
MQKYTRTWIQNTGIEQTIFKKLKILSDIWQAISQQKCIQIADNFHCFYYINACYQNVKKSLKKRGNFPPMAKSEQECLCRPIAKQTIGLSGVFTIGDLLYVFNQYNRQSQKIGQ